MIKLEEERKRNAPPSVLELEKRREDQKILKNGAPRPPSSTRANIGTQRHAPCAC